MDGMTSAEPTGGNASAGSASSAAATPGPATSLRQLGAKLVANLPSLSNVAALALLLWFAIGATCEIVKRNDDYARVVAYEKFLISCRDTDLKNKACPKDTGGNFDEGWIAVASHQVRRYNSLNGLGAIDRCHVAAVIASPIGHFWEDCLAVLSGDKARALQTDTSRFALASIVQPPAFTYSGWPFGFDERPKEPLYFLLVLASSAIGAVIAGLRTTGFSTHRDLALGVGAGFAIYLLLRGGNFVFFTGSVGTDILNPFTASAVGLLVGLFSEKAFAMLGKAMPEGLSPVAAAAVQKAMTAQTDAASAIKKLQEDLAAAASKGPAGLQQKDLQDLATAALNAKAKTDEVAKAQGEAFKPPPT